MPKPVSQYLPAWKMEKTKSIPNNEFLHQGDVQWQHKKNRQQKLSGSRKAALIRMYPLCERPLNGHFLKAGVIKGELEDESQCDDDWHF